MFNDMAQIICDHSNTYRMTLQGALNSPIIDWCGDITVIPQENSEILLVNLLIDQAALCGFLDQFRSFNITILPIEHAENEIPPITPENLAEREMQWIPS